MLSVAAHTREVGSERSRRRPFFFLALLQKKEAVARSSSPLMLWKKESSHELCYYDSIRSLSSGSFVSLEELVRKFDPYRRATVFLWCSQEARCTAKISCLNILLQFFVFGNILQCL
jgi:hypothetical protein